MIDTVKIAFVMQLQYGMEGNGATYTATQLISELSSHGHDVTVYGTKEPPTSVSERVDSDIDLRTIPVPQSSSPYKKRFNQAVRNRVKEFDEFDITHIYDMQLIPALQDIGAKTTTRTIVTLQAYSAICPKNDLLYQNKEQCNANGYAKCSYCTLTSLYQNDDSDFTTAVTRSLKRSLNRLRSLRSIREANDNLELIDAFHTYTPRLRSTYESFGYPANRIAVIRNILDPRFVVDHISDFAEPYNLLYVGRLETEKGVHRLIPVLSRLLDNTSRKFTLTIAGDGYLQGELKRQTQKHDVDTVVDFIGHVPHEEMPKLYASHDLFVYPGLWNEPFGRIFLEALATGTPVVATDVGSASQILGDAGIITDNSIDGIVEAVKQIVKSETFEERSTVGIKQVQRFRPNIVLPKFESLYQKIHNDSSHD